MRRYVRNVLQKLTKPSIEAHPDFDFAEQDFELLSLNSANNFEDLRINDIAPRESENPEANLRKLGVSGAQKDGQEHILPLHVETAETPPLNDLSQPASHSVPIASYENEDPADIIEELETFSPEWESRVFHANDWAANDVFEYEDALEFSPWEFGTETSPTHLDDEDIFELDLWESHHEPHVENEQTADDERLDRMAAELVIRLDQIHINNQKNLHRRFRDILIEFPHATSHAALIRLLSDSATLEDLEDACALKCLWRDCNWLWLQRRYDKLQNLWDIQQTSTFRHSMSWKVARSILKKHTLIEAEASLTDNWLTDWQSMRREDISEHPTAEAAYFSYPSFIFWQLPQIAFDDFDYGFSEPINNLNSRKALKVSNEEGALIWQFSPSSNYSVTDYLSCLPYKQRRLEQASFKAK